ncbi:MAG: hypothetical protein ACPGQM_01245 [Alphaproteobacteria bacterium]
MAASHQTVSPRSPRFTEITPVLAQKMDAIAAYDFEMRDEPHARSPQAVKRLARVRGDHDRS